jgi:hypothetical protein
MEAKMKYLIIAFVIFSAPVLGFGSKYEVKAILKDDNASFILNREGDQTTLHYSDAKNFTKSYTLKDHPLKIVSNNKSNIVSLVYLYLKGAKSNYVELYDKDGIVNHLSGNVFSLGHSKKGHTFIVRRFSDEKLEVLLFDKNGIKVHTGIVDNSWLNFDTGKKAISYDGSIIFDRPNQPEGHSSPNKITYAPYDNLKDIRTVRAIDGQISDALFIDNVRYYLSIKGSLVSYNGENIEWSRGASVPQIFYDQIKASDNGKFILAADSRNGFFSVFNADGNKVLTWDPYISSDVELGFLDQTFNVNRSEPNKELYKRQDSPINFEFVDHNTLLLSINESKDVYLVELSNTEILVEHFTVSKNTIASNFRTRKTLDLDNSKILLKDL